MMLVSHRHRFIFTKTKKTAGTSIEVYFEPYCMAPGEWRPDRDAGAGYASIHGIVGFRGGKRAQDVFWWNHMPARQIRDGVGAVTWSRYFRFSIVRNPYEKAVSAFFMVKQRHKQAVGCPDEERLAFQHWLEAAGPPIDRDKYLLNGRYCLSDIIRLESCLADLERICERLGVPFEPERLERRKAGIRPAWATAEAMFTPISRTIVAKAYAFELDFFGYGFPGE